MNKHEILKARYEEIAKTKDFKTTACDFNLRELEIETALEYLKDGDALLDVGCGLGYALMRYAGRRRIRGFGIDYAHNMIDQARVLTAKDAGSLRGTISFQHASVLSLPFPDNSFDVVTSSRCLMALLEWKKQKKAILEIHRVLKKGGILVLMEGTIEGVTKLNHARSLFGLAKIDPTGRDRLFTLKFKERQLRDFCKPCFKEIRIKKFGMYYFLTRIIHPLLVAPDAPRYDAKINEIARQVYPYFENFNDMGHLAAFILKKK